MDFVVFLYLFLYVYFRETCCFRLELLFMLRVQVASQKGETCTPSVEEYSRWLGARLFTTVSVTDRFLIFFSQVWENTR